MRNSHLKKKTANRDTQPDLVNFTLLVIYKNLYLTGLNLMRLLLRTKRRIKRFFMLCKGRFYAFLERVSIGLSNTYSRILRRLRAPFVRIAAARAKLRPVIASERAKGKLPLSAYLKIAHSAWPLARSVIRTLFNYLAPVAALWFFLFTVNAYINQPLALEVQYNGEVIGYVRNELEFEKASQTLRSRFITTSSTKVDIAIPRFKLVSVVPEDEGRSPLSDALVGIEKVSNDYTPTDELANKMVLASGNTIETAYGLYVDNRFYGAVTDREFLTNAFKDIYASNSTGIAGERVEFVKKVALQDGLYPESSIISPEELDEVMQSYETVNEYYIAEYGDSPMLISDKTAVPYSLLMDINPGLENGVYVGDEILTAVARPFLSVQNIYTDVYNEVVSYETVETENDTMDRGTKKVEQEGVNGIQEVTAEITMINGVETGRVVLGTWMLLEPVEEQVTVGTKIPPVPQYTYTPPSVSSDRSGSKATSATGYIWPTVGGYINGGIGSYPGHSGIDIPNPYGTNIYASAAGTVTLVKRTYSDYGLHVMITHSGGYQTLYAHCSNVYVSAGDTVSQGQVIAAVGSTGRSSGNHLHFEVRLNGRIQIPQYYVGYGP